MASVAEPTQAPAEPAQRLRTSPISPVPEHLAVGGGTALFLDGCCSHPDGPVTDLRVAVDDVEHPVMSSGQPPPGRLMGSDYWWAIVPLPEIDQARLVRLRLRGRLSDGRDATAEIGLIELRERVDAPDPPQVDARPSRGRRAGASEPLIAVCMATYDPPLDLFERQVDSIRAQTHRNWVCIISDDCSPYEALEGMRAVIGEDDRFLVFPSSRRLGFYLNFERALALAPLEAAYVALSDQDDRWSPEKLDTLRASLESGSELAYSDMRIVGGDDRLISDTYWSYRRNNHTNFGSLLVANTVTGAASLFKRGVLDYALPFPPRLGNAYHDHWIALVAMSLGRVSYVDRPLYDYVQHGGAAIGHARANAAHRRGGDPRTRMRRLRQRLRKLRREGFHPGWRYLYFDLWCPIALTARVAELRCGAVMAESKRKTLSRFEDSRRGVAWLAGRSVRPFFGATETLSRERALLAALAWRRLVKWRSRLLAIRRVRAGRAPRRRMVRSRPAISTTRVNGQAGGRPADWLEPILVDYFTRDGSTLMMRLLSSSPEIAVEEAYPFERKYFAYIWRWARVIDRADWPEDTWGPSAFGSLTQERQAALIGPPPWRPRNLIEQSSDDGTMADRCFELAWSEFSRRASRWTQARHGEDGTAVSYYAEKHLNTWLLDLDELPPVRLLAIIRDPRDTFVSINAFNRLRGDAGFGRDRVGSGQEHVERVIARQRKRLRWIARLLDENEVPVIRYEELVMDLPAVARRLESWLGVRLDPAATLADRQVRRVHVSASSPAASIGRWRRELDPAVAETFSRELAPELRAVGLED